MHLVAQAMEPLGVQHDPIEVAACGAVFLCGMGGVLIATGILPRLGCVFVVAFLAPATYYQHYLPMLAAQAEKDVRENLVQKLMVMKNLSMMGAALMLFGYECALAEAAPRAPAPESKSRKKHQ